ncbi:AtpZ/AtpI family protein [Flexibacter flexilis]|uniref:AtpZ/AtpI family protein n=1 Tax=Flexibacter flexilis TaxID=998 RepID=UPI001FE16F21|nr:AtpZ/AtpI family protein [Flexibacter flexilis]
MEDDKSKNFRKSANLYAKYSGLAFQMVATIGLFTYAGIWLDGYWKLKVPYMTISLSLLAVTISLVAVIRDLGKDNS